MNLKKNPNKLYYVFPEKRCEYWKLWDVINVDVRIDGIYKAQDVNEEFNHSENHMQPIAICNKELQYVMLCIEKSKHVL